ncbi:hypothetical protein [Bradyrhizobium sp. ARR65]|uniref:hypothetical protein n=1 Tax=Bradyrhizobium sp. ARR65 TaxID=1040989 RepID=UPI00054F59D0|nr:hypothetical protein [Bradyrhizobium sp. ARR65]
MVDSLKRSLEQVEAPTCPSCRIQMKWYRSTLIATDPVTITHSFACPNCERIAQINSVVSEDSTPPPRKLSAPRIQCAA